MSAREHYRNTDTLTLQNVEPIGLSQGQLITERSQLEQYVEAPALAACQKLYDKNIQTVSASANRTDQEYAYIDIDAATLSGENHTIATELGGRVFADQAGVNRIKLAVPISETSTVDQLSQSLQTVAEKFSKQYLIWAPAYTFDELATIYGYKPGESVTESDFVREGYYLDEETGLFYVSKELYEKAKDAYDGRKGVVLENGVLAPVREVAPTVVSPEDWEKVLVDPALEFEGNIEVGAQLMAAFSLGRKAVEEYFASRTGVDLPPLWLLKHHIASAGDTFDYRFPPLFNRGATVMQRDSIAQASSDDPDKLKRFLSHGGEVAGTCTMREMFFTYGVEETHHAVFRLLGLGESEQVNFHTATDAEYHATEQEWQALAFRIKFAKQFGFSEPAISSLEEKRRKAAELRRAAGLPTDAIPFLDN